MDDLIGFIVLLCLAAIVVPILLAATTVVFIAAIVVFVVLGLMALWASPKGPRECQSTPRPEGCQGIAAPGDSFCRYCRSLIDDCLA